MAWVIDFFFTKNPKCKKKRKKYIFCFLYWGGGVGGGGFLQRIQIYTFFWRRVEWKG